MKVQFLEPMGGKDFVYETHTVYDLPNATAKRYIEHGICIADSENVKEEIKAKSQVIAPKKKKK